MNDNDFRKIYNETMNNVSASDELVNNVKELEVSSISKKTNFRIVSAIAACLVVVVVFLVLFNPFGTNGNSFVLKAGAADINSDSFVKIGELYSNSSSSGKLIINAREYPYKSRGCVFKVSCEGNNIKTVRYSVENGVFVFPLSSYATQYRDKYPEATEITDKIYNKVLATEEVEFGYADNVQYKLQYSSFSMAYEDQLKLQNYEDVDSIPIMLFSQVSLYDKDLSEETKKIFEEDTDTSQYSLDEIMNDEELFAKLLDEERNICDTIFNRVRVTVEVTYEDGTTDSDTFMLGCDSTNEYKGFVVTARMVQ